MNTFITIVSLYVLGMGLLTPLFLVLTLVAIFALCAIILLYK